MFNSVNINFTIHTQKNNLRIFRFDSISNIEYNKNLTNEKKAISNAYLIPPAQYWSIKKMISEYKGNKNMQKAGFLMIQHI